jgi:hypothetical protein
MNFPSHCADESTILHSFYNGLNYMSRCLLDSVAGCDLMTKTVSEAKGILENMLQNHSPWLTDRAPHTTTKKVNSMKEVDGYGAKLDAIMAMLS